MNETLQTGTKSGWYTEYPCELAVEARTKAMLLVAALGASVGWSQPLRSCSGPVRAPTSRRRVRVRSLTSQELLELNSCSNTCLTQVLERSITYNCVLTPDLSGTMTFSGSEKLSRTRKMGIIHLTGVLGGAQAPKVTS